MDAERIGPRQVCRLTCNGCPALKTEGWTDYLENDETDSGTRARCEAAGKHIDSYWHETRRVPEWCPAVANGVQPSRADLNEAMDKLAHLVGWAVLKFPDNELVKPAQRAMETLHAIRSTYGVLGTPTEQPKGGR